MRHGLTHRQGDSYIHVSAKNFVCGDINKHTQQNQKLDKDTE